ncbi:hypothetical protein CR513_12913, partial [Mucuna pruriens]
MRSHFWTRKSRLTKCWSVSTMTITKRSEWSPMGLVVILWCGGTISTEKRHVETWPNLMRKMRLRFVPTSYARDLYNSKVVLQRDGSRLLRANVLESNETTLA